MTGFSLNGNKIFGVNTSNGVGSLNTFGYTSIDSSNNSDIAIGTRTNNAIHFVVNNNPTDSITISANGVVYISNLNYTTANDISSLFALYQANLALLTANNASNTANAISNTV